MNTDVFIDTVVELLSQRDLDGEMTVDFADDGTLMLVSHRGTVYVAPGDEDSVTWTLWCDGESVTTEGVPSCSDHDLSVALRSIGGMLGI